MQEAGNAMRHSSHYLLASIDNNEEYYPFAKISHRLSLLKTPLVE